MFGKLRTQWKAARGEVLRRELDDYLSRVPGLPQDVQLRCVVTIADCHNALESSVGGPRNTSGEGQLRIAQDLRARAKRSFDLNMGQAWGLILLSLNWEARTLPGPDAEFVTTVTSKMIQAALETVNTQKQQQ